MLGYLYLESYQQQQKSGYAQTPLFKEKYPIHHNTVQLLQSSLGSMGQGWMSSLLAIDIALTFAIVYILWKITAPFIESYHKAANMDLIAKCPNRHWFYGHIRAVRSFNSLTQRGCCVAYMTTGSV